MQIVNGFFKIPIIGRSGFNLMFHSGGYIFTLIIFDHGQLNNDQAAKIIDE